MNNFFKLLIPLLLILGILAAYASSSQPKLITLNPKNFVAITTEINAKSVANTIVALNSNSNPIIYLYIDSPGGSVIDGMALINYLKHTNKNIHCIANYAASMAHAILESCPVRLAVTNNILMQHKISGGAQGTPGEIEGTLKIMRSLENYLNTLESKRIGITKEEFERRTSIPWYTVGEESLKENVVDDLVDVTCSPELYSVSSEEIQRIFIFEIKTKTNGCPLVPLVQEQI